MLSINLLEKCMLSIHFLEKICVIEIPLIKGRNKKSTFIFIVIEKIYLEN